MVDIPVKENAGLLTGSVYFEGVDREVIFTTSTSEFLLLQKGNGEFNIPLRIDSRVRSNKILLLHQTDL